MTLIETETSPLRAAREWREISLVAAARASGLQLSMAEALEAGDASAFATVDEMVAAAVLYGATLGIGRDEAMALLDRTIAADGARETNATDVEAPSVGAPAAAFSAAVRERSVQLAGFDMPPPAQSVEIAADGRDAVADDVPSDRPVEQTGELPLLPTGGVESAQIASMQPDNPTVRAAMELDPQWRDALEQSTSELEQWVAGREQAGTPLHVVLGRQLRPAADRVLGPQRTDRVSVQMERLIAAAEDQLRDLRTRLERSEHATLIVALAVGMVLVAALLGIASATGGDEQPVASQQPVPAASQPDAAPEPAEEAPADAAAAGKQASRPSPVLPPARISLRVLNAGSTTGQARTMADQLKARGYTVEEVGNSNSTYATSVILYPPKLEREAQRLSRQTKITTLDTLPNSGGTPSITIVVV